MIEVDNCKVTMTLSTIGVNKTFIFCCSCGWKEEAENTIVLLDLFEEHLVDVASRIHLTLKMVMSEVALLDIYRANPYYTDSFGDAVSCSYSVGDQHCIVGEILSNLGIEVPIDGTPENVREIRSCVSSENTLFGVSFDQDALDLLQKLQCIADSGVTWGKAVTLAKIPTLLWCSSTVEKFRYLK